MAVELVFTAACNAARKYFLASTHVAIDTLQFPFTVIDPGCSSMLLPIDDSSRSIVLHYLETRQWRVVIGIRDAALQIHGDFLLKVEDQALLRFSSLRFELCQGDVASVLPHVPTMERGLLQSMVSLLPQRPREYAVLGQDLLHSLCAVTIDSVLLAFRRLPSDERMQDCLHLAVQERHKFYMGAGARWYAWEGDGHDRSSCKHIDNVDE
eukprot:TRINITY_DN8463_c0_g1_i1.p1 TRINITY_DN8463_c0_g1~~TRINITY_DN8463_c0_g1_i1.p1  ORF type:complete len:226 (+),score=13.71 TRINITY_DN8463_c0_g1_i1:49-678(+)